MKRKTIMMLAVCLCCCTLTINAQGSETMRKQADGTYVVNTTGLCNAKGFRGSTPVEVYIKNDKVTKIVPLSNQETPEYFGKVKKQLLPKYKNQKLAKAKKQAAKTDARTGATYSTKAVQQNIQAALDYYTQHVGSNKHSKKKK